MNSLSVKTKELLNQWSHDTPLYLMGPSGSGKSEIAQSLLQQHHIIHITREHIKFKKDISKYIQDSLFRKNVLMMMATTSSIHDRKALLIDDIQVFVKHDKPSLKKIITLIKQCSPTYKIICCGHPTNDKSVQSLRKMCYTVDLTPKTSLLFTENQPSLKDILNKVCFQTPVSELFRLCSSEYSITSLNLLENYPTLVTYISPQQAFQIYTSICYGDNMEYKYIHTNLDMDLRIFYSCILPLIHIKQNLHTKHTKHTKQTSHYKYNSYISRSMIQIHNQTLLKQSNIDYLQLIQKFYQYYSSPYPLSLSFDELYHPEFILTTLEKQLKLYNYLYHKQFTRKQLNKIYKEVYEP